MTKRRPQNARRRRNNAADAQILAATFAVLGALGLLHISKENRQASQAMQSQPVKLSEGDRNDLDIIKKYFPDIRTAEEICAVTELEDKMEAVDHEPRALLDMTTSAENFELITNLPNSGRNRLSAFMMEGYYTGSIATQDIIAAHSVLYAGYRDDPDFKVWYLERLIDTKQELSENFIIQDARKNWSEYDPEMRVNVMREYADIIIHHFSDEYFQFERPNIVFDSNFQTNAMVREDGKCYRTSGRHDGLSGNIYLDGLYFLVDGQLRDTDKDLGCNDPVTHSFFKAENVLSHEIKHFLVTDITGNSSSASISPAFNEQMRLLSINNRIYVSASETTVYEAYANQPTEYVAFQFAADIAAPIEELDRKLKLYKAAQKERNIFLGNLTGQAICPRNVG